MVFAGYLAASIAALAVLPVPVADDAVSDTVGALAIVLMAVIGRLSMPIRDG